MLETGVTRWGCTAAIPIRRVLRENDLAHPYRKMCARLGRPAGITATAHKLARIIFHVVTTGQAYDQSIFAAEEQRQRKHLESSLRRKAAQLGYQLTPLPQTA